MARGKVTATATKWKTLSWSVFTLLTWRESACLDWSKSSKYESWSRCGIVNFATKCLKKSVVCKAALNVKHQIVNPFRAQSFGDDGWNCCLCSARQPKDSHSYCSDRKQWLGFSWAQLVVGAKAELDCRDTCSDTFWIFNLISVVMAKDQYLYTHELPIVQKRD